MSFGEFLSMRTLCDAYHKSSHLISGQSRTHLEYTTDKQMVNKINVLLTSGFLTSVVVLVTFDPHCRLPDHYRH